MGPKLHALATAGMALAFTTSALAQPTTAKRERPPLYKGVHTAAELRAVSGLTDSGANTYADMAAEVAGKDWPVPLEFRCRATWQTISHGMGPPPPTKLFDNLFYVGTDDVSSHALVTSGGIIVFDAMNDAKDVAEIIAPGIRKVGLDPKDIKYIIVTHEHIDHVGGVNALKALAPNARVAMSQAAWDNLEKPPRPGAPPLDPALRPPHGPNDIVLTDGMKITLGDTTLAAYLTPGHTPGTTSFILPGKDGAATHMVALYGGSGVPVGLPVRLQFRQSLDHFQDATDLAAVDSEITIHNVSDDGMRRLALARARKPGQPNPYVLGRGGYIRYQALYRDCASALVAQSVAEGSKAK